MNFKKCNITFALLFVISAILLTQAAFALSSADYNLNLFPLGSGSMSSGSYSMVISSEGVAGKTTSTDYQAYFGVSGSLTDQNVVLNITSPANGATITSSSTVTLVYAFIHSSDSNFTKNIWATSGGSNGTYINKNLTLTHSFSLSNATYSLCVKATKKNDLNTVPVCVSVTVNVVTGPVCGNGSCEAGEDNSNCPADCEGGPSTPFCGDHVCNGTETYSTCPGDCHKPAVCGDAVIDAPGEQCDTSNLNNKTCVTQAFTGGTLSCAVNCTFNTSACYLCGNGTCESSKGETTTNCLADCPKTLLYEKQIYEKIISSSDLTDSKITSILAALGITDAASIALAKKANSYIPVDKNVASFEKKYSDNTFEYYSIISVRINNTLKNTVTNLVILDVIPKAVASNASELKSTPAGMSVLVADPTVQFTIASLAQQSETALTYKLDSALDATKTASWESSFTKSASGLPADANTDCILTCDANHTLDPVACVCNLKPICGDGSCNGTENSVTCPSDCAVPQVCGDGSCNGTENNSNCPSDCPLVPVCGDGKCSGSETHASCPSDCPNTWQPPQTPAGNGTQGTGGMGGMGGSGGSTHTICVNYKCVSAPGSGKNECSLNTACNLSVNYLEYIWLNSIQTVRLNSNAKPLSGIRVVVQGMVDLYTDNAGTVSFKAKKAGKFNIDLFNDKGVLLVSLPFIVEDIIIDIPSIILPKQTVNIKIRDSNGNLIKDVMVELLDEQNVVLKKDNTDGYFQFMPTKEGFLKLVAYKNKGSNEIQFEVGGLLNSSLSTVISSLSYLFGSESKNYPWTIIIIFILVCIAFLISFDMFSVYFPLKGVSSTEFRRNLGLRIAIGIVFFIVPIICSRLFSISIGFISAILEIIIIIILFLLMREQMKQKSRFQLLK